MKKLANDKGITLVALIITIIILLILASITIPAGREVITDAKLTNFGTEMHAVQLEVNGLQQKYKNGDKTVLGIGRELQGTEEEEEAFRGAEETNTDGYRYYDAYTLESLGLKDLSQEFLVNVSKRKIISLAKFNYKGQEIWTISQIPNGAYNVEFKGIENDITFDVDIVADELVISNIEYTGNIKNGTIYYGQGEDENSVTWKLAKSNTNDTSCKIGIKEQGTWYVKIVDSAENSSEIKSVDYNPNVPLSISRQPSSITVTEEAPATFTVGALGRELTYQWYRSSDSTNNNGILINGATSKTYTIQNAKMDMNNTYYYCVITQVGTYNRVVSDAAKLTVKEVNITPSTDELVLYLGEQPQTVVLSSDYPGEYQMANIAQIVNYAISYEDDFIQAKIEENILTVTPKALTHDDIPLNVKEMNTGKSVTINVIVSTRVIANFDANGGSVRPTSKEVSVNRPYGDLPTPTRNGYAFVGWVLDGETSSTDTDFVTAETLVAEENNHTLVAQWKGFLKVNTNNTSAGAYLGTSITRDKIKKVSFTDSIAGHSVDNINCFDVSAQAGTGEVLLWVDSTDGNGNKEIVIGQNGGVLANPNSSYLFAYVGYGMEAEIELEYLDTSEVTNMASMFNGCGNLTELNVSFLDTKNVNNMGHMFQGCNSLVNIDISGFNLAKVTSNGYWNGVSAMFQGCSSLVNLNTNGINTENIVDMEYMFDGCSNLIKLDVSGFNTNKVISMYSMFKGCSNLTELDVSKFDTSNVINMESLFNGCSNLTELDVSKFDTGNVTNMFSMFNSVSLLTSLDVSKFDTKNVTNMARMFMNCNRLTELDVSKFDTKNVTNIGRIFNGCSNLTELDISGFNITKVTTGGYWNGVSAMFQGCSSLVNLNTSGLNIKNIVDMEYMFDGCRNLTELDLGGINTSKVTSMYSMFNGCTSLIELDVSKFDTSNVINMESLFNGCSNLTKLDVSKFDTGNVTNMSRMFEGCSGLTELDVSKFDTKNVTNMARMFERCSSLTKIDVSRFNLANVTSGGDWGGLSLMFSGCSSLTKLDISGFDTSNVISMRGMFQGCIALTTIYSSENFVITSIINGRYMFSNCIKLIGGTGTIYSSAHIDYTYARIDGGPDNPGYFTDASVLENLSD